MAKTFNRAPVQVNTPSSNDIKNYFFNHFNWKGVNADKNFLTVDQETFADSKNVYVNGENTLRSRPSIKRRKNIISNYDILDIWNINNVIVIFTNDRSDEEYPYKLYFYSNNEELDSISVKDNNFKFAVADNKIFIFSQSSTDKLYYFDLLTKSVKDNGIDFIYVPKTEFNAAGVKTNSEDKNILTDKEIHTYLYNSELGIATEAYGKLLTVDIAGKDRQFVFNEKSKEVVVEKRLVVPENHEVIISNTDTYLIYSESNRSFSFSPSGLSFTNEYHVNENFGDIIAKPKFSQDGRYVILGTTKSIYFVQVIADDKSGELSYPFLTDIRSLKGCESIGTGCDEAAFDFESIDSFAIITRRMDDCKIYRFYDGLLEVKSVNPLVISSLSYNHNFVGSITKGAVIVAGYSIGEDYISDEHLHTGPLEFRLWSEDVFLDYAPKTLASVTDTKVLGNSILIATYSKLLGAPSYDIYEIDESYSQFSKFSIDTKPNQHKPIIKLHDSGNKFLSKQGIIYLNDKPTNPLLVDDGVVECVAYTNYIYYLIDGVLYTSNVIGNIEFKSFTTGDYSIFMPGSISYLSSYYFAKDNILYISEYREEDGEFKWYIPEKNKHVFDKKINALEPISTSEMGIFFEDEIWYSGKNEAGYTATKSKLQTGVLNGSSIVTSYDGSRLMFCTKRGFVGMTYQDFIASTDQVLSFLSDPIYSAMEEYCKTPTKLFQHNFWVLLYKEDSNSGFIFDTRNNSWWPVEWNHKPSTFIIIGDDITILSDSKLYKVDTSNDEYYDYDGSRNIIHWYVVSQKLHLSASNYYKHIVNMTLSSVIDSPNLLTYYLTVTNYRDNVNTPDAKIIRYKVHTIKTHVQRLNHPKVNEFQYRLETDMDSYVQMPLSISDLTVKYKITGQVR